MNRPARDAASCENLHADSERIRDALRAGAEYRGAALALTFFLSSVTAGAGQAHLRTSGSCSETSRRRRRNRCARKSRCRCSPNPPPVARGISRTCFSFSSPFSRPFLSKHQEFCLPPTLVAFEPLNLLRTLTDQNSPWPAPPRGSLRAAGARRRPRPGSSPPTEHSRCALTGSP